MGEQLIQIFDAANKLSPLAIIGLLVMLSMMLARSKKQVSAEVRTIGDNHLHELPELVENSRKTVELLQRIEVKLSEKFATIEAKLNGTR